MSAGRVRSFALLGAALVAGVAGACGERSGDPVFRLGATDGAAFTGGESPAQAGTGGVGASAGSSGSGGGLETMGGVDGASEAGMGGDGPDVVPQTGPLGLCAPCTDSRACGDANDACVRHADAVFCGRDCDEQGGCPDGYVCVPLQNTQLYQCVPQTACATPTAIPPLAEIRDYLLQRINSERAANGHAALAPSACLDDLAQASAVDYAHAGEPLGKYVKECDPIWPNCACGWNAEAETSVALYDLDWLSAVDLALTSSRSASAARFVDALATYDADSLGIGFWISGDEAWLALSFH